MSIASQIGDALNLPESIALDCRYKERRAVRRLLEAYGVDVRRCQYYNGGIFAKGLIVHVRRYQGTDARRVLAAHGYREIGGK